MKHPSTIGVFAGNDAQGHYLAELVRLAGGRAVHNPASAADMALALCAGGLPPSNIPVLTIETPRRAASLIGTIEQMIARQTIGCERAVIGDAVLHVRDNLWVSPAAPEGVRLTDKETEVLLFLFEAISEGVSRETLLHHVWGYSPEAQTHTLETHIYRLRQKIEPDPAAPRYLLTLDDGYAVAKPL
jgi:hypothetical protein